MENGKWKMEKPEGQPLGLQRGARPFSIFNFQFSIPSLLAVVVLLLSASSARAGEASAPQAESGMLEAIFFYVFSAAALVSGLMICLGRNVVRMAVWLFFVLASVALLYFLLGASFLAAIQLIVYVGGTLILLIFGVMLTNKSPWVRLNIKPREMLAAAAVGLAILAILVVTILATHWPEEIVTARGFTVGEIGNDLLTKYLVPFEVASVLLLTVMIGAAYLARQEN